MKGYVQCEKGHFYKKDLQECPYCPKAGATKTDAKTKVIGVGGEGSEESKTTGYDYSDARTLEVSSNPRKGRPKRDLSKTYIQEIEEVREGEIKKEVVHQRPTRKIVGWMLSYTIDPMGVDFRIYEGNNTLGRKAGSDIVISTDPSVSGHHATILFKKNRFYLKDEMAANGTFLNGDEIEIGQPVEIKDGDKVKLGKTLFVFKTPL